MPVGRWIKRRHRAVCWLARSRAHYPSRSSSATHDRSICSRCILNPAANGPCTFFLFVSFFVFSLRSCHVAQSTLEIRAAHLPTRHDDFYRAVYFFSSLFVASFFLLRGTRGSAKLLVQHQTNGDPSRLCPPLPGHSRSVMASVEGSPPPPRILPAKRRDAGQPIEGRSIMRW